MSNKAQLQLQFPSAFLNKPLKLSGQSLRLGIFH